MSKLLSLKLNDDVFRETEAVLQELHKPRNAYVNEAVDFYNRLWKRKLLRAELQKESALVADESLDVLEEFEAFEDDLSA